jgi:hypothetical protein
MKNIALDVLAHLLFFCGLVSIIVGLGLIGRPLGVIAGGLALVWIAFLTGCETKED